MRTFKECFEDNGLILTEGAVVERVRQVNPGFVHEALGIAPLIYSDAGRDLLETIYKGYLAIAAFFGLPMMVMTNTRKCHAENTGKYGFRLHEVLRDYHLFLKGLTAGSRAEAYIGGLAGCCGDAYDPKESIGYDRALRFHAPKIEAFADLDMDFLFAGIMPEINEARALAELMGAAGHEYIISFMIDAQGTLLDNTTIDQAIRTIDDLASPQPLGYMANCVHPDILCSALLQPCNQTDNVRTRFKGLQANASPKSAAELNRSEALHTTGPEQLYARMERLNDLFPLKIAGGCCGTDDRHIRLIAERLPKRALLK